MVLSALVDEERAARTHSPVGFLARSSRRLLLLADVNRVAGSPSSFPFVFACSK